MIGGSHTSSALNADEIDGRGELSVGVCREVGELVNQKVVTCPLPDDQKIVHEGESFVFDTCCVTPVP